MQISPLDQKLKVPKEPTTSAIFPIYYIITFVNETNTFCPFRKEQGNPNNQTKCNSNFIMFFCDEKKTLSPKPKNLSSKFSIGAKSHKCHLRSDLSIDKIHNGFN